MKKKAVSALLCAAMVAGMLAGCGKGSDSGTPSDTSKGDASNATESASSNLKDDGKVLNIYCWNEEFKSRITAHYPDYKEVDATHGKIGDVDVVWNITPSDDNAYRNNLDAAVTSGRFSFANVAANKTILSFFGRIMLVALLGILIPNLNI